jgi:hypothetical protein
MYVASAKISKVQGPTFSGALTFGALVIAKR